MSSPATDPVNDLVHWDDKVGPYDFEAARSYLSILLTLGEADAAVRSLESAYRREGLKRRRVNDILRACGREALPDSDPGVFHCRTAILRGEKLSPVLIVSFKVGADIADGYHRVSTVYNLDPFADALTVITHIGGTR